MQGNLEKTSFMSSVHVSVFGFFHTLLKLNVNASACTMKRQAFDIVE